MSERNTEYQFVSTDTETVEALLISIYEKITGVSVKPASPEKLFIQFVAAVVIQERGLNNYTGNQNIPSRAEGENLDALAELFYVTQRPAAKRAVRSACRSPGAWSRPPLCSAAESGITRRSAPNIIAG